MKHHNNTYDPFVENPVPTAIGLFLLAIVMVTLNLVAIVVFVKKQRSKPPVDYPLLSLLIANLLQGAVTLPAYALKKINAWDSERQAIICDVYRFSYFLCAHASILSLLASSIDRLIALVYSLQYWQIVTKKRISVVLVFIWLGIIAFDVIPLFPITQRKSSHSCHYIPTKYWSVSMHVIMNIIPLPILLANYIVTIRIAFKHAKKTQLDQSFNSSKLGRRDKLNMIYNMRATRKVLLIIGSYFICVGPACIYYLLEWLCKSCYTKTYKDNYEQYLHFVLKVLVNFNAVISPVIFFWNSKVFRKSAKEIFSVRDRFSVDNRKEQNSFSDAKRLAVTDSPRSNSPAKQRSTKSLLKKVKEENGELLLNTMKTETKEDVEVNGNGNAETLLIDKKDSDE